MTKSPLMQLIELKRGKPIERLIREQLEEGRSQEEVAADLGISFYTLRSWMYRLGARLHTVVQFESEETQAVA